MGGCSACCTQDDTAKIDLNSPSNFNDVNMDEEILNEGKMIAFKTNYNSIKDSYYGNSILQGNNYDFNLKEEEHMHTFDPEQEIKMLTKIQSLARGFLSRKRIKDLIEENNMYNVKYNYNYKEKVKIAKEDEKPYLFIDGIKRAFPIIIIGKGNKSYEGEWVDGRRNGFGLLYWKDGSIYKGFFSNDKANGLGKQVHKAGEVYLGQWKNDHAEGLGTFKNINGCIYRGEWKFDKQFGFGTEKWVKGNEYIGEFKNGAKEGLGMLVLEDGSSYIGEFSNNTINGIGKFQYIDGKNYEGEWKENKMHGYGVLTYSSEKSYEGYFISNVKTGLGVYRNSNKIYIGVWNENKLEGEVLIIDKGVFKNSYWINGKKEKYINIQSNFISLAKEFLNN